jgi:D-serine deaminase-like pyridoxal phosphate-dependent protein
MPTKSAMLSFPDLSALETPSLLLDEARMTQNIGRLSERAQALDVTLRPHLKTCKSAEIARRLTGGGKGPVTVSTLAEAEAFFAAGFTDVLYAVGIAPQKLQRVLALRDKGCDLTVVLDSRVQAEAVARASRDAGIAIPALIEIDCDGHRGGLLPGDPILAEIGRLLHQNGAELRGVLTHAGESYGAKGTEAQAAFAETERSAAVRAAQALRTACLPCPVVSVGSTPTAHAAQDLTGVTELRAGVYAFFDLFMAGIGVCAQDDIALSVLTTVIGHKRERGWIIVDAGWMALSRDRGTANQDVDHGYGVVCSDTGKVLPDLIVSAANQEHGIITLRPGAASVLPDIPVGNRLRIIPNHACATAAQHSNYNVIPATGTDLAVWPRFGGW